MLSRYSIRKSTKKIKHTQDTPNTVILHLVDEHTSYCTQYTLAISQNTDLVREA